MSTVVTNDIVVNEPNTWRLVTPGHAAGPRTARPGAPNKYFMVSGGFWMLRIVPFVSTFT